MLIYEITLGLSLSFEDVLENVIQSEWLEVLTILFPSSLEELRME